MPIRTCPSVGAVEIPVPPCALVRAFDNVRLVADQFVPVSVLILAEVELRFETVADVYVAVVPDIVVMFALVPVSVVILADVEARVVTVPEVAVRFVTDKLSKLIAPPLVM